MLYYVDNLLQYPWLIRWEDVLLRHICHALDHCHFVFSRTRFFPFMFELYTLFFERVHVAHPLVHYFPAQPMFDMCMCMWRQLMPKRDQSQFPITLIGNEVFDLFSSGDNLFLDTIEHSYMGIDWGACLNIQFIT
jgi:hypothetical protein